MNRLVVLGSVNADRVLRVPHFPRPCETLTGHSYQVVPGGRGPIRRSPQRGLVPLSPLSPVSVMTPSAAR